MERIIVWYLRMSLIYLFSGAFLGLKMVMWPDSAAYYRSVHVHLNLLGFMAMMIYGVGYHILPRFSGRPVYSPLIVRVQFWFANAGLLGMAISWPFIAKNVMPLMFNSVLILSSILAFIAVILFVYNILKTVKTA
ncbi:MAG: cbb3-type cytochrome c oxidase subunit I [Nitrospirae bacterium]|nr:cbb3-type cytochrome c oxidase subunit I [Nitrospirota bacterium]